MLSFQENKAKSSATGKKREDKQFDKDKPAGGPAWHDPSVDRLQVRIEDSSRLRKLKREEAETHISGEQYAIRL